MANPNDFREMSAFALAFATEYKKYMKAHKVKQRQIAEYLGFTEAYVSERVNGKRAIDTNDVDALAALSGTTGRSLMIETGSPHQGNIAPAGIRDSSVASQLEKVIGKKIQVEKAAYRDENKQAESGRENMD